MNITLANQTENFTPNFKGNLVPYFALSTEESIILDNRFDTSNHKGDSFEFAKALAKDLNIEDTISPYNPQKIYVGRECLFDSTKSLFGLYADTDGKNAILSLVTGTNSRPDFDLDTKSNEYPETIKVVRGFLEKMIIKLDTKDYSCHAEKDVVFETCINLLKKLRK